MQKLSPTPRKSERERKNISYDKLNKGAANSDEEDLDQRDLPGKGNKKKIVWADSVIKKVTELFETMKTHEHSHLFNQPLDTKHPMYDEMRANYMTLSMLDLHFKIGDKYKTTDEIANDFRSMIMAKMKMSMQGGDPVEYKNI